MIRFIGNFILFGFIFFLIHRYLPEVFNTLVSWVNISWDFIVELFNQLVDKFNQGKST